MRNYPKKDLGSLTIVLIGAFHNHESVNESLAIKLKEFEIENISLSSRNFDLKVEVDKIKNEKKCWVTNSNVF